MPKILPEYLNFCEDLCKNYRLSMLEKGKFSLLPYVSWISLARINVFFSNLAQILKYWGWFCCAKTAMITFKVSLFIQV
jgi:hypothetical protein